MMMFQHPTPGLIRYILCDDVSAPDPGLIRYILCDVSVPDPGFNKVHSV